MVVQFLNFWGTSILFFIVTASTYSPTNRHGCCLFSTSSPTLVLSCLFCGVGLFRAAPTSYGGSRSNWSCSHWPIPQPQQHQIQAESVLYTTAHCNTGSLTPDPNRICNLHHSSLQHWILNPLSKARNRTYVLTDSSRFLTCWATTGTPISCLFVNSLSDKFEVVTHYGFDLHFPDD